MAVIQQVFRAPRSIDLISLQSCNIDVLCALVPMRILRYALFGERAFSLPNCGCRMTCRIGSE
jgi:hypothetical protein